MLCPKLMPSLGKAIVAPPPQHCTELSALSTQVLKLPAEMARKNAVAKAAGTVLCCWSFLPQQVAPPLEEREQEWAPPALTAT
jgi:hypothetical protein